MKTVEDLLQEEINPTEEIFNSEDQTSLMFTDQEFSKNKSVILGNQNNEIFENNTEGK